jgi:predicted transcriptional regulator
MIRMELTRKVATSFTLAAEQIARLDAIAVEQNRSRSWIAGRAIDQFLAGQPKDSFMSATIERGAELQRKQAEIERERAAEHARQQERVLKSTEQYLRDIGSK